LAPKQEDRRDVPIPDNDLPEYESKELVEEFNKKPVSLQKEDR
jgi:hypothetical protein